MISSRKEIFPPYFNAAVRGEEVYWEQIAKKYKTKLDAKFVDENILRARVNALGVVVKTNGLYWKEYIDLGIKLVKNYGTDTVSSFATFWDAQNINNFVFEAIFFHSDDPVHLKEGLNMMEGVIRRNPTHANNIDTYANLLYKAGQREEAIKWQEKGTAIVEFHKEFNVYTSALKENLEKMKKVNYMGNIRK